MWEVTVANRGDLAPWIELVSALRWNFPGLETAAQLDTYQETVRKNIGRKSALCAKEDGRVIGVLLFSPKRNQLSCMAVRPEYRRQGVATRLVERMLDCLDSARDVTVTTFREGDERGRAPRALYQKLGFIPDALGIENDCPVQRFIRPGKPIPRRHKKQTGSIA